MSRAAQKYVEIPDAVQERPVVGFHARRETNWLLGLRDERHEVELRARRQYLIDTLGIEPADEAPQPARRSQSDRWAAKLAAARKFRTCEGHLHVPRKHVEHVTEEQSYWAHAAATPAAELPS